MDPAPRRTAPTWPQFLRSPAEAILACDFFTAELLDGTQANALAVIEARHQARPHPRSHPASSRERTARQARNLIMDPGEQAHQIKLMIRDRGSHYTAASGAALADAGIRTVPCNVRTPPMNAIAERWTGGCRRELLDRTLIRNQAHLRRIPCRHETPP
jgi:putative transposase